ncbi:MAG: bifunctional phosphopantothenoylcysteine decarboxylase/phosphopantothenate--cysteine ligase CoaBC [Chloroflexi bacterium]|nr:bifunctional phosphopantothenoylcysteine decarboxylase/phosphopantothenate--cysteine ligase CoaBC [Chloroflexota bacterium]
MPTVLDGKHVVLGVCGSIAAYKSVDLASKLVQLGALVDVVMTDGATRFVGPISYQGITHRPVVTDLFSPSSELSMDHVALAQKADIVLIAPATANVVAKLACGLADDALTATVLATNAPIAIAPAGDANMFGNPVTKANLDTLRKRGVHVIGPVTGRLASGMVGEGRLEAPERIIGHVRMLIGKSGDLAGAKVVVSAGGTQEPIDPVRYVGNRSSGKMGFAIAEAARDRGAAVTLITSPVSIAEPVGVKRVDVRTALEMRDAVLAASKDADLLVMSAAVADFRPEAPVQEKIKRRAEERLELKLVRNPDIIAEASGRRLVKIAFAVETSNLLENARAKLDSKNVSLVVANDVTKPGVGFGTDTNQVTIVAPDGSVEEVPLMDKFGVAQRVLDRAATLLKTRKS